MKSFTVPTTLVLAAILLPAVALAQFGSSIQGTIMDQSGAVIPGASVTLTDISTGIERTAESVGGSAMRSRIWTAVAPPDS